MGRDPRRLPEPAHAIDVRRREAHMRGERIGEAADFAAAHRIGLPSQRKRRRAGFADPSCREMAIEDRIDLVGALRRLVDALRIQRNHARRSGEHLEKCRDILFGEPGRECSRRDAAGHASHPRQRVFETAGVSVDITLIERVTVGKMRQQSAKQRGIRTGLQSQKQVGIPSGIGSARIDHDDARAALLFIGQHALEQDRVAPRGVGADQHQEIGLVEIFIAAGHGIGAEGTAMARDR
jgi:hypothetical protein